ncbi:MAG TPA: hypothetical protein PKK09_08105 [Anaerolineaceae bacterium]|nr:hypothetical protein [Anaerolineaceae bacterium]
MEKVTLWVPCGSRRPESWSQVEAYMHTEEPDNVDTLYFRRSTPGNIGVIWNGVIKEFLDSDSTYLWSVHDDVVYAPETLVRLMSWNKPLISALVFHRQNPQLPHIWALNDDKTAYIQKIEETYQFYLRNYDQIKFGPFVMEKPPEDSLTEIGFTSTSCTLIHRSVLEALREPMEEKWFRLDDEVAGGGEDRNFFEHAREAGFPSYVDRSCVAGHLNGDLASGVPDFMVWHQSAIFRGTGEESSG